MKRGWEAHVLGRWLCLWDLSVSQQIYDLGKATPFNSAEEALKSAR